MVFPTQPSMLFSQHFMCRTCLYSEQNMKIIFIFLHLTWLEKDNHPHTHTTAPFDDISLSRSSFGLIVLMGTEQAQKYAWLTIDVWAESLLSVLFSTHTFKHKS